MSQVKVKTTKRNYRKMPPQRARFDITLSPLEAQNLSVLLRRQLEHGGVDYDPYEVFTDDGEILTIRVEK